MSKPENLKCPDCGGPMVSRLNRKENSRFWGCKDFPKCKGTRDVNGLSRYERQTFNDEPEERHEYNFQKKREY